MGTRKYRAATLASSLVLGLLLGGATSAGAADLVTLTTTLEGSGQDIMTSSVRGYEAYWDEVFDWAIEQDPATGALKPGLATKWTVSDDGLTWTFDIRDGVKFHDGSTLNGGDVAWSWSRLIFDPKSTSALTDLKEIISGITADGNVVTVKTKVPLAELPFTFARPSGGQGAIQSKEYFDKVGPEVASQTPIGTGPYKFVSLNGTQSVELEAFTDPGRSDWQKEKTPAFDHLTIQAVPEPATRIAMLQAGEADVVQLPISAVQEAKDSGFNVVTSDSGTFSDMLCVGVALNPKSACNDVRVRQALNLGINRQGIADAVYGGLAKPSNAFFAGPGTFGNPTDLAPYPFDPDKAKQLLADAGYTNANPLKVEIDVYDDDGDFPDMPTMAEAIAGDYNKIGIQTNIVPSDWGAQELKLEQGTLPGQANNPNVTPVTLWMRGIDNRYDMIAEQVQSYTNGGPKGKAAWSETNLPDMKAKLLAVQAEFDPAKREAGFADYNRWMAQNYYQIPLLAGDSVFALSDKVASWDGRVVGRAYIHNQWSMKPAQ
ncbi:MAG TPA: ABC transporter substrate-binding protein [Reyranella sp.]